jgi:protein-L-isoaspartate O-methyltransferase
LQYSSDRGAVFKDRRAPLKTSETKRATAGKAEFMTMVNEHFHARRNAVSGVFRGDRKGIFMNLKFRTVFALAALFVLTALMTPPARFTAAAQGAAPEEQEPREMRGPDVVFVGTPYDLISTMLQMANIKKTDTIYDLGCGDGRILVLAAQKYGVQGIDYDIDPQRVTESRQNVSKNNMQNLVKIIQADIFTLDLEKADVMPLYLHPDMMRQLVPQVEKMKPGSRIVCHEYGFPDIYKPDQKMTVISNEDNAEHHLMLYTLPLKRE